MKLFKAFDHLRSVESTNQYLKSFVEEGVPRIAVAKEQTAGKGRFGRNWHSPAGEGLYVSYLLYPGWRVDRSLFLNMMGGLATLRTIRYLAPPQVSLKVKPPNDVLVREKKVCGILTEMSSLPDRILWAIVGIGVNLHNQRFPAEIAHQATSLALEGIPAGDPLQFCEKLTGEVEDLYFELQEGQWEMIRAEYDKAVSGER